MAQLTELLRVLQPLDGRDEQTLYNSARKLREEGLLPKGKRGSGAPELSFEDAANVLLGVVGSTRSVDAADRCRLLGGLKNIQMDWTSESFEPARLLRDSLTDLLSNLPQNFNLIANAISSAEKIKGKSKVRQRLCDCVLNRGPVALNLLLRGRSARLEVITSSGAILVFADYVSDPNETLHKEAFDRRAKDREVVVQFGLMTLVATHYAVGSEIARKDMDHMLGMSTLELLQGKAR